MKLAHDTFQEEEIHESIINKRNQSTNSGYLDQQYEITKDFPRIHQFHFRIEDQHEIIELQKLKNRSEPMNIQTCFSSNSSQEFQKRLSNLLVGIDSNQTQFQNTPPAENQRFYMLADHYPEGEAIQQAIEKQSIKDLSMQVQKMSIKDVKYKPQKKDKKTSEMVQEKKQVGDLQKKMKRLTINYEDL